MQFDPSNVQFSALHEASLTGNRHSSLNIDQARRLQNNGRFLVISTDHDTSNNDVIFILDNQENTSSIKPDPAVVLAPDWKMFLDENPESDQVAFVKILSSGDNEYGDDKYTVHIGTIDDAFTGRYLDCSPSLEENKMFVSLAFSGDYLVIEEILEDDPCNRLLVYKIDDASKQLIHSRSGAFSSLLYASEWALASNGMLLVDERMRKYDSSPSIHDSCLRIYDIKTQTALYETDRFLPDPSLAKLSIGNPSLLKVLPISEDDAVYFILNHRRSGSTPAHLLKFNRADKSLTCIHTIPDSNKGMSCYTVATASSDGKYLALGDGDGILKIFKFEDLEKNTQVAEYQFLHCVSLIDISFLSDNRSLLVVPHRLPVFHLQFEDRIDQVSTRFDGVKLLEALRFIEFEVRNQQLSEPAIGIYERYTAHLDIAMAAATSESDVERVIHAAASQIRKFAIDGNRLIPILDDAERPYLKQALEDISRTCVTCKRSIKLRPYELTVPKVQLINEIGDFWKIHQTNLLDIRDFLNSLTDELSDIDHSQLWKFPDTSIVSQYDNLAMILRDFGMLRNEDDIQKKWFSTYCNGLPRGHDTMNETAHVLETISKSGINHLYVAQVTEPELQLRVLNQNEREMAAWSALVLRILVPEYRKLKIAREVPHPTIEKDYPLKKVLEFLKLYSVKIYEA